MSGLELLADEIDGRLHAAVVKKGVLDDLYVDGRDKAGSWASIYLGKIVKIDTRLDAAIVDLGAGLTGFLPAKHVHFPGADPSETRTGIADLLKAGQTLPVQVKTEAKKTSIHENHKLPRLTTKLYGFGQYLVYSPLSSQVTMSRRIEKEAVIKTTSKLRGKGGWIVQVSAEAATEENILREADILLAEWQAVNDGLESGGKPRLLRMGPGALHRAFNDYGAASFTHVHAGNKDILGAVMAWSEKFHPPLAASKRLRLFRPETGFKSLFDLHDVHTAIEALSRPAVDLPSGGSIIIEPTQAVVVVDVNQGSAGGAAVTNTEAALEAARQMRLRNLSGAILVDFINMDQRNDRSRLVDTLAAALADDTASAQVHGFTRLGIIEVTRKRRAAMLHEKLKS